MSVSYVLYRIALNNAGPGVGFFGRITLENGFVMRFHASGLDI